MEVDTSDSDFSTNEEVEEFLNKFEKVLIRWSNLINFLILI